MFWFAICCLVMASGVVSTRDKEVKRVLDKAAVNRTMADWKSLPVKTLRLMSEAEQLPSSGNAATIAQRLLRFFARGQPTTGGLSGDGSEEPRVAFNRDGESASQPSARRNLRPVAARRSAVAEGRNSRDRSESPVGAIEIGRGTRGTQRSFAHDSGDVVHQRHGKFQREINCRRRRLPKYRRRLAFVHPRRGVSWTPAFTLLVKQKWRHHPLRSVRTHHKSHSFRTRY